MNEETENEGEETPIWLPPEEVLKLQQRKNELMRAMLDKLRDGDQVV